MSLRLLFGMLASALPDQRNYSETMEEPEKALPNLPQEYQLIKGFQPGEDYAENYFQGPAQLHIGMLTISLLVGLAYGGYVGYTCWMEKNIFLGYIRNLVIALVCRTFFTVIFDGVVLLGSPFNLGGGNALSAFEQICLNLVLGFWLSLTVYAHARVQRNFKSEPTMRLYQYGIPGIAAFFAFIWIFVLQDVCPNSLWWLIIHPFNQWIVNSANLLFLLIQLVLVGDMCRMMLPVKASLDNDSLSLLWKVAAMMGTLVFIFWLHFGLSLGSYKINQSYMYFFFFIDGVEGTLVCVCFYFFYRWVTLLRNKWHLIGGSGETEITTVDLTEAEVLPGGRGIVTVDSICVTRQSERWETPEEDGSRDVVYSNVVEPHRLQKTLELYKRLNVIPSQVTVVEGDQFYDCQIPAAPETANYRASVGQQNVKFKNEKTFEPIQKKNAFYSSKYLILDSKQSEFPKYLETRPSVSSMSEKESQKDGQTGKTDVFAALEAGELVRRWLNENSGNMPMVEQKELSRKDSDSHMSKPSSTAITAMGLGKKSDICVKFDTITPTSETPTDTITPTSETPTDTIAPTSETPTDTIAPTSETPTDTITPTSEIPTDAIALTSETPTDAVAPTNETPTDAIAPTSSETPTDAQGINKTKDEPSEGVPKPKMDALNHCNLNQGVVDEPTPTKLNEPEDKPTESPQLYLTYSQLLEYRSKREKSDEPPAVTERSIFSKVIDASTNFLNSLTGYAQTGKSDFATDEGLPGQLPDHTVFIQRQSGKILEELPRVEPKPQSDATVSSRTEGPTAQQPEVPMNDFENRTGMHNLEQQSFIRGRDQSPYLQLEFTEQSRRIPVLPHDRKKSLESNSSSEFSIEKEQNISSVRGRQTKDKKSLETSSGSKLVQDSFDPNKGQPSQKSSEDEEDPPQSSYSLSDYYTKILNARTQIENQQSCLKFK